MITEPITISDEDDWNDHAAALARIDELFTAKPGTPEGDELDLLVTLVELYEEKQFPIALPSPVEAIRFRMEQQGLKPKDLVPYIGSAPLRAIWTKAAKAANNFLSHRSINGERRT